MQRDRVRSHPVSCQSCRSKKLRCNRTLPCSNCTTRGISCNFLVPPRGQAGTAPASHGGTEILGRLERLESILLKPTGSTETHMVHAPGDSLTTRQQSPYPSLEGSIVSNVHQKRDQDPQLLESARTREDALAWDSHFNPPNGVLRRLSNGLAFRVYSMHEILETTTHPQHPTSVSHDDQASDNIVIFPVYRVATLLFKSYHSNVDHLFRILHIPTIRSYIRTFYLKNNESDEPVSPGQAALLLSIFAVAAYFYQLVDNSDVATTQHDAIRLSQVLSRGALDVLDYSRRTTPSTLEDAQASVIMSFVTYHLDGFSARGRFLTTAAISIIRELRLHRLDADNESSTVESETTVQILILREIKRRVFWHIAATDWCVVSLSSLKPTLCSRYY